MDCSNVALAYDKGQKLGDLLQLLKLDGLILDW